MAVKEILIIDDDPDDQDLFLAALANINDGFIFKTASDGEEGYTRLEEKKDCPDLILLDLNMPLLDGESFLKKIKANEQLRHIPVVIFSTGSNFGGKRSTIIRLGAKDYITKPNSFGELEGLLRRTLEDFM